jgi:apolipoprotein D and lipocalin family protein
MRGQPLRNGLGVVALLMGQGPVQAVQAVQALAPLQTVAAVDLQRYMGTWHEIARYPNRFQRQCMADTTATYRLLEDGGVEVLNRCRKADGRMDQALGRAVQSGGPQSPRLQVRFAPSWLSFLPMVWGDYWIVALEADYRWVIVSEPARQYLWVLARTPALPEEDLRDIRHTLLEQGFDPARLERPR